MVQGIPRLVRRGLFIALSLACAHAPVNAQSMGAAKATQVGLHAPTASVAVAGTGKLQGNQLRTRFLVGLPKTTKFEVFSLNNPNRVVIEIADTNLRLPAQPVGSPVGLVKSFRAGLSAPSHSRIILEVTEPVIVSSAKFENSRDGRSQELVVEIEPFGPVTASIAPPVTPTVMMSPPPYGLGAAGLQPPSPRPAVSPQVMAQRAFKPVIVIDPGHGGHDSGAEKNGAVEKDIVLAFGKKLAEKLRATGRFKVFMTRDEDVFVPLGERVEFAEKHNANLFIAVHCDYADNGSKASGATIYSLRDSAADSLRRSTRGEVASNVLSREDAEAAAAAGDADAVKSILADLAGREVDATHDRTGVFARTVVERMGASTNMREDPSQQAGFRVLKTAQFPSVLIELAYVTNKQDAENLQSDSWREKVSDSILTAVDKYFSNQLAQLPM
jgi:N-acetylmuramoyl-L-alanine amidase